MKRSVGGTRGRMEGNGRAAGGSWEEGRGVAGGQEGDGRAVGGHVCEESENTHGFHHYLP